MKQTVDPFGIFFQLGYVARDIRGAVAMLETRMGARRIDLISDFADPAGNAVAIRSLAHLSMGDVEIEIIQPRLNWPSIYLDALPIGGAMIGLHHLGYMQSDMPSWEAAMRTIRASGMDIAMEGDTPNARFAYVDTRPLVGHFTEMVYRASR